MSGRLSSPWLIGPISDGSPSCSSPYSPCGPPNADGEASIGPHVTCSGKAKRSMSGCLSTARARSVSAFLASPSCFIA